jgi:hypothetical protein
MLAQVVIVAVDGHDGLAGRLVKTIARDSGKTRHGRRLLPGFYRFGIPETAPSSETGKPYLGLSIRLL